MGKKLTQIKAHYNDSDIKGYGGRIGISLKPRRIQRTRPHTRGKY